MSVTRFFTRVIDHGTSISRGLHRLIQGPETFEKSLSNLTK